MPCGLFLVKSSTPASSGDIRSVDWGCIEAPSLERKQNSWREGGGGLAVQRTLWKAGVGYLLGYLPLILSLRIRHSSHTPLHPNVRYGRSCRFYREPKPDRLAPFQCCQQLVERHFCCRRTVRNMDGRKISEIP